MKKKIIALVAGALMALSASSAFAAFADLDLIRVVYQKSGGTVEVATDLGSLSSILATSGTTTYGAGDNAFTANTGTLAVGNTYYVAYFASDRASGSLMNLWVSGVANQSTGSLKSGAADGILSSIYGTYATASGNNSGASTVQVLTTAANSYYTKTSHNGTFGAVITSGGNVDISLANVATAGFVTQNLFYDNDYSTSGAMTKLKALDNNSFLQIQTNDIGETIIINPAGTPTPIPAAAYLLGSGLLGLVGIRRKGNKA